MPRYLEELYPHSQLQVIEIDPEVTRVAFDYLGLSPDTHIVTYNQDARMVVPKLPKGQYDLVIGDAFNDISIPFHLTTREFNEQIRALLTDDGIYAVNVVDKLHSGRFLRAYVNTLQQTFPYVHVILDSPRWEDDRGKPYVVVGSFQPLSSAALGEANTQAGRGRPTSHILPEDVFTSWLNDQKNILLTDSYAPVDNLVAHLHLEKRALQEAEKHWSTGIKLDEEGKLKEAIAEYDKAIHLDPYLDQAYHNRSIAYLSLGQFQRALQDCNEAIRLNPGSAAAYFVRALVHTLLNMDAEAQQDVDWLVRLGEDPSFLQAEIKKLKERR